MAAVASCENALFILFPLLLLFSNILVHFTDVSRVVLVECCSRN